MEKLVIAFRLEKIGTLGIIDSIVTQGFLVTGNKFQVNFCGSKGYLDHVGIHCEGNQDEYSINRIDIAGSLDKKGCVKKGIVRVHHSGEKGIRISVTKKR